MEATSASTQKSPSPQQRLIELLRLESNDLWVAIIFSAAIGLLTLAVPVATQSLVNTIAFGSLVLPVAILALIVLVVLVVSSVIQVLRFQAVEMLQRRIFVRMSSVSAHGLLGARTRLSYGPAVVNYFLEVVTLQKAGASLLVDGLSIVMQTLTGMILLGLYHPWLLAFDLLLLVALFVVIVPLGSGAVNTAVKESKAKHELVAWLEEIARNETTFRGEAEQHWAFQRCNELVSHYLTYRATHFYILRRQFVGSLTLQALASALLLGVGGMLVIDRQLTLGQLVAAELVVAGVLSGISKLAKHLESLYDLLASLDKLGILSDLPVEASGEDGLDDTNLPIRLHVRAPGFKVRVDRGARLALTGVSGSGKSTFIDAVCGYSTLPGWAVEIDGVDILHVERSSLRSHIGLVRGTELFRGTILENIRVGRDEIPLTEIQETLARVGIWEAIQALPQRLNTVLGSNGVPLSEGQAQALMLARALIRKPRLLIIDETLDHIQDLDERRLLSDVLFAPNAPWTLIIVTTREDLLRRCQKIIELPSGRITEVGG